MIKPLIVLVPMAALIGCGGPADSNGTGPNACNAEHITTIAETGQTGLVLLPSQGAFLTLEQIDTTYRDVEQCTGISAIGPQVVFSRFGEGGPRGAYSAADELVTINADPPVEGIANDCNLQRQVLRHEFVHYLLGASGVWGVENVGHASPLFDKCGQIVTGG